ncbi:hypothetical protein JB92DRAFT_3130815 [Gautieria morchelliformis]|nr:hypothetical protein JB92DRAFT_3130815 [Gautieria morchelliformis]
MAEALAGLGVAGKSAILIFLLLRCSSIHSASVIAVVQLTEDVIGRCSAYGTAYRNASKDMSRLSDQISGLHQVLLNLNGLIVAEDVQRSSRLPTLTAALSIPNEPQTSGKPPLLTNSEDGSRPGNRRTESMPIGHASLLKSLLKKFKRKGRGNTIEARYEGTDGIGYPPGTTSHSGNASETHVERTDGTAHAPAITGDVLATEGGNTAGNASDSNNDRMSLPRVLRDCHDELQSLAKKLETKDVRASRMEALFYAFKQGEVNKTLDNLQRFQQQLVAALAIDQARLVLETHDNQRRQDIYNWLSAPDYESKHLTAITEREGNTGAWFVQGDCFQEWRGKPKSFLWLHGKAGAGKTILCSTIIREISRHCESDASLAIAFFYFDFHSKDTTPPAVLRALIKQLSARAPAKTSPEIPDYLADLFYRKGDGEQSPSLEELASTLKSIIGTFKNDVYIIFDALDECPDRPRFLKLMKEIQGWNYDKLHLLATSRYERDIEKTLRDLVSHQVPMDESLVNGDIQVYVSRQMNDDPKFISYSEEKREAIKTTLMDGAHGMYVIIFTFSGTATNGSGRFRWVVCQLDSLRKCRSPHELQMALTDLPPTLYETYDRILLHIDERDRVHALKLLQWLAFAVDKVSLSEAVDVLATNADAVNGPLFDRDRRFDDPWDILTICSNLVTFTVMRPHADYLEYEDRGSCIELKLAHFSVREYLVSEGLRGHLKLTIYHCNEKQANMFMAKTCVAYLLQFNQHDCISKGICICHPLSLYAARYWIHHSQPDNDYDIGLRRLIMALFQSKNAEAYSNWLELEARGDPIYYTSMAGLTRASQDLLENGVDIHAQGGIYGNALQAASLGGHQATVELLLEKGADVNVQGGECGNALQASSLRGHQATVELLLEKGADINAQGGLYGNALQAASLGGHQATIELLLEKGADVNAQGGWYGNALQAASLEGHQATVVLLLEKGGDINVQGGEYGNALQAASLEGHQATVELLLERGAEINAQGGRYGNALQAASSQGHQATVVLLLERGADINAQGGEDGNALQAASTWGHQATVELLLEKGAGVLAREGCYSALQAASSQGYHAIFELLLKNPTIWGTRDDDIQLNVQPHPS